MTTFTEAIVEAAALRDALLPKLISGEIRLPAALRERAAQAEVKDAERFLNRRGGSRTAPTERGL